MKKQLRIVWLALVTGIIIAFSSAAASAATITVTSLADGAANAANCPSASNCRLRDAIAKAASGDTINFSVTGTITLNSGRLIVNRSLNINGPGAAQLAISGNNANMVFRFMIGTTNSISGLAVVNGWDDSGAGSSGGIINEGALTLTNCWVKNNSGVFVSAILSHGSLSINNSTFSGNTGEPLIRSDDYNGSTTMNITNSTISDNGGGIVNVGNTFTVTGSTISGNSQSGFANYGGNGVVINSTISGNYSYYGGGFFLDSGTAKIINSTVTGNQAGSLGGGLYQQRGTFTLRNTIVAGNSVVSGSPDDLSGFGVMVTHGYNLIGVVNSVVFQPAPSDKIGRDWAPLNAKLGPLADNGGPTKTHALLTDSPAINAGDNCVLTNICSADNIGFNLTTEQRGTGFNRKLGASVDMGAFETDAMITTTSLASSLNPSQFGQEVTFTASVVPADSSFGVPTGTVQFKDGENNLGSPVALNGQGKAALSTSALLGGTHTVSAIYIPTGMFFSSTASIVHNVDLAKPTILKSFSPTTIQAGENSVVTLTLTNRNNIILTNALFTDNLTNMSAVGGDLTGTCARWTTSLPTGATTLNFRVTIPANGSCTVIFPVRSNTVGVHPNTTSGIVTDQTPTAGLPSNTANLTVVAPPVTNTTTTVTTSQNPILTGQAITLTATVVPSVLGIVATGTVQFKDGATNLGSPVALDGTGKAVRSTSFSTGGTRTVSAVYNPTSNFNTSTGSLSQTVYVAYTTTSVTSSQNPIEAGQNITFTATVTPSVSGIVPTGTVQFKNGATNLGSPVTLDASGRATYITSLSTGSHTVSAEYNPTGNFGPSTGQITQTVYASTSPTITKAFSPSTIQQGGTSTVTLTLTNPNAFSLTNASFTDVLTNMNAAGGAVTGTCAHTIPNIPPSIRNLTFNTITIPANGSCTVIFSVKSSTIGVHPNTTSGVTTNQTTTAGLPSNTAYLTVAAPQYAISGKVTNGGQGLFGVTISLTGGATGSFVTDASGNYSFANLAAGANYTLTPSLAGYTFVQPNLTFNALGANQTSANFATSALTYEADAATRPTGNGTIDTSDLEAVGRMIALHDTAPAAGSEFQRADAAPRTSGALTPLGDGKIDVLDIVQIGRYAAVLDPLTPAGGPTIIAPTISADFEDFQTEDQAPNRAKSPSYEAGTESSEDQETANASAGLSAGSVTATIAAAIVPVQLTTLGDVKAIQLTINYDQTKLAVPTDLSAAFTNRYPDTTFVFNTATAGRIGVVAYRIPNGFSVFPAGSVTLFNINFTRVGTPSGTTTIGFSDSLIPRLASDPAANTVSITSTAGTVTFPGPTAANVIIGGRVMNGSGRGISNATVTLIDLNGLERTALTNPFGYYRFADVEAGANYILSAKHKSYRFSNQVIAANSNMSEVNFTGSPK